MIWGHVLREHASLIRGMMRVIVLLLILIGYSFSQAEELVEANISARAMGMGNAYTSVVDDKDALFYNPARLSEVKGIQVTLMDPYIGANGQDVYDTFLEVSDSTSSSGTFANQLRNLYGRKIWLGGGGKTAVVIPGFGASGYTGISGSAYLSNPAFPNLNVKFFTDYGFAAGVSTVLMPGFSVGLVGKRISRIGAGFPIGVSTLALLSSDTLQDQLNNRGTGYAIDLGTSFSLPSPVKPTFSLVWKNMGQTTFTQDFGAQSPPSMKDEMIFSFSMLFDGPGVNIRPAFDLKYFNRYDEQLGKKIHAGLEIDLPFFSVRAGLNQGYYTVGLGVDFALVRVDAATYGVELGEYPGQHEDRRYLLQATMQLGFDPKIGSLNTSGSAASRGLKPRR